MSYVGTYVFLMQMSSMSERALLVHFVSAAFGSFVNVSAKTDSASCPYCPLRPVDYYFWFVNKTIFLVITKVPQYMLYEILQTVVIYVKLET